jgi:hypothetical protein
MVSVGHVRVVCGSFVLTLLVVLACLAVMPRGLLVMLRCLVVMLCPAGQRHVGLVFFRVMLSHGLFLSEQVYFSIPGLAAKKSQLPPVPGSVSTDIPNKVIERPGDAKRSVVARLSFAWSSTLTAPANLRLPNSFPEFVPDDNIGYPRDGVPFNFEQWFRR